MHFIHVLSVILFLCVPVVSVTALALNIAIASSGTPCQLAPIVVLTEELARRGHHAHVIVPSGALLRCQHFVLYRARCHAIDCCNVHRKESRDRQMLNSLVIEVSLHVIIAASRVLDVRQAANLFSTPFIELMLPCNESDPTAESDTFDEADGHRQREISAQPRDSVLSITSHRGDAIYSYPSSHHVIETRSLQHVHMQAACPNVHFVGQLEHEVAYDTQVYGSGGDLDGADRDAGEPQRTTWYNDATNDLDESSVVFVGGSQRIVDVIELVQHLGITNTDFMCHDSTHASRLSSSTERAEWSAMSPFIQFLIGFVAILALDYYTRH